MLLVATLLLWHGSMCLCSTLPRPRPSCHPSQDVARDHDTRKSPIKTSGPTYRTALDALPDSVINPAPAAAEPGPIPPAEEVEELETAEGAAAASAQAVHEAEGAEASPARQQYNTTAQRYAAYRLRAAQGEEGWGCGVGGGCAARGAEWCENARVSNLGSCWAGLQHAEPKDKPCAGSNWRCCI